MLLPRQIVALGKIVARVAGRYGSSKVRIERHAQGPRAMATDGRRAVVFTWQEPDAKEYPPVEGLSSQPAGQFSANVPPKALADAGRAMTGKARTAGQSHLLLDESSAAVVRIAGIAKGNITRTQADGEEAGFPDCNEVLPTPARDRTLYDPQRHGNAGFTHTRIGVNARQLAETLRVVSELASDDAQNTVVMTVPVDPRRPLRLDARCADRRAAAAVMPVTAEFSAYDEPNEPARQPARRANARPVPPTVPPVIPGEVTTPINGNVPRPVRTKARRRKAVLPPPPPPSAAQSPR